MFGTDNRSHQKQFNDDALGFLAHERIHENDDRFGSLADIGERIRDVRFLPESGHGQGQRPCPLSAKSGR